MIEVLVALPLVLAIGLICHEIGHAVLFALCGHAVTAFGSGLGRPFLVIPWAAAVSSCACIIRFKG